MEDEQRALARELEALAGRFYALGYRDGLRPGQWQALRFFAYADPESRRVSAFARFKGITQGAASVLISRLVQRGLLARSDRYGGRNVGIVVTDAGRRCLERDPFEELVAAVGASDSDARVLHDWLRRVRAELEAGRPDQGLSSEEVGGEEADTTRDGGLLGEEPA